MNSFTGRLKKVDNKFVHVNSGIEATFNMYKDKLEDGDIVEVYMEKLTDDGNLAQIAKVHALIRTLSLHIGQSSSDTKLLVKDEAGLCLAHTIKGKEFLICKSFADCSRDELSLAISACIEIGKKVNLNLH